MAVVLNWCAEEDTTACVQSLLADGAASGLDVLLVDNASPDGSGERLAARFPELPYLQTGANIGYAGGNRLAITSADALAGAGGGGMGGIIDIRVTMSPEVKVEVVNNAVKQARVQIVQDMSNDSQLSRVTRQKMA